MKHKYLHELFPKVLPFPYGERGYPKFDERDTFNLDSTLIMWIYEHFRYFQDVVAKKVVMNDPTKQKIILKSKHIILFCITSLMYLMMKIKTMIIGIIYWKYLVYYKIKF